MASRPPFRVLTEDDHADLTADQAQAEYTRLIRQARRAHTRALVELAQLGETLHGPAVGSRIQAASCVQQGKKAQESMTEMADALTQIRNLWHRVHEPRTPRA